MERFDDVIIGAGQAGPFLAVKLAAAGRRVAVIEKRSLGGTCVNDGCIPTKTLVASARAAWVARNAATWGVEIEGPIRVDMAKVKARKDAIVGASVQGLESWLGGTANLEVIRGAARFVAPRTVEVAGRRLEAERVFLNTGGRVLVPRIPGLADVPFLTNTSMMDLDVVPPHLIVLGGSYIGLEFAQMYRRFGSEVTVIEKADRLVPREDDDVSTELRALLEAEGLTLHTGAEATAVARRGDGVVVTVRRGDGAEVEVAGSHLLLAIGRVPNTDALGLDVAGVDLDARGYVVVDDELRTTAPGVWAMGDCNGRGAFTHTSYDDHQIVAANLLGGEARKVSSRIPIYGLYTDPPLGRCGMSEREARASGRPLLIGKRAMARVGRARERGETRGFIKIICDADTRQILGAAILGVEGDEAIHCVVDVMYCGAPYTVLMRAVHAHPTVAELIPTVLEEMQPAV
ncbi:MAG: FAD-containing oxidoreductase [Kofleriaceae bacterium]|nr:FAD-containing oxidoreductase [Myxococcales bacterium]MCB9561834.1 FAD-containing oxidoreductase [Kofleriaceae bacterium]MCB9574098.1 FAD-containing oxidoreductase [Kofleriaceae bacterium]